MRRVFWDTSRRATKQTAGRHCARATSKHCPLPDGRGTDHGNLDGIRRGQLIACLALTLSSSAWAGPNLLAIGNFTEVPFQRAEGRDSFSGNEIVYSFDDPEFDFGRVIVRSTQPKVTVRRDLFVGFTGNELTVNLQAQSQGGRSGGGGAVQIQQLEIWLRINGRLRPGASYEWEMEGNGSQDIQSGVPAVIPALWADGEQIGAEVSIAEPEQDEDSDAIRRLLLPHGIVKLKSFEKQTGAAWIILKPTNYGSFFSLRQFSFREIDSDPSAAIEGGMPVPVRYIPIRNVLEDDIAAAVERGTQALKAQMAEDRTWGGDADPAGRVLTTARVISALAELDPTSEDVKQAMQWLAKQSPPRAQPWSLETAASRLYCLARHGGLAEFGPAIQADVQFLVAAQAKDGGWADRAVSVGGSAAVSVAASNHDDSVRVLTALREARFAGAEPEKSVWKSILRYWTEAQVYDGGFSNKLERFGGVGQAPTSAYTATGAAALLSAIDMSAGIGNKRCSTYLAGAEQLRAVTRALEWLNKNYKEQLKDVGSLVTGLDPYLEPARMQLLGGVSGIAHFHDKEHFDEEARDLLQHYDPASGLFGVKGQGAAFVQAPNLLRTADALSILGAGAAPTVVQRIIVGDAENNWGQYRSDAQHLVRYLATQRGRQFNWRRTTIDREVRELVEVPILVLSVLGPISWSQTDWQKVREYCLAGGSVVIDISEDAQGQRDVVATALKQAFPEYALADLPPEAPIFSIGKDKLKRSGIQALGNGLRHFLFLPKESWSCQWHLYQVDERKEAFAFMNNLVTYATDDTPPRSSFAGSTYAVGSVPSKSMKALRLQVGSTVPAYPSLMETMDRLMRSNFRLSVTEPNDAKEADLVWVEVAGPSPPSDPQKSQLLDALRGGKYLFVDVVSGNKDWDESFRAVLKQLDPGIKLEKLRRGDPVYTGEVPGTQGFDAVKVNFRKALHTRFSTAGRCDLYAILWNGKPVGVYSAYDISSGIGYHYFPECRGIMPRHARELAMNVFLAAYGWKNAAATGSAGGAKG